MFDLAPESIGTWRYMVNQALADWNRPLATFSWGYFWGVFLTERFSKY
jgi:hypothetical protein